jgi:hypothetical protein
MAEGAAGWWLDERRPLDAGELADELAGLAWKGSPGSRGRTRDRTFASIRPKLA